MLRRNVRLRREYLNQKYLEEKEKTTFEKKRKLRDAIENEKGLPADLRGEEGLKLRKTLRMHDDKHGVDQKTRRDDEYAYVGTKDPKVLITTSRDPSSRLTQFLKEMRLVIPDAQRVNRGSYVMKDLVDLCRQHEMTDLLVIHEHRGEPDGLILCHLPYGPTAYFGLKDVVTRHDLQTKAPKMSEARPHLIFHDFDSKLGLRVKTILQALFPPTAPLCTRTLTFANEGDQIHFRHHTWEADKDVKDGRHVELTEVGPRFRMMLYKIENGTLDMKDVETEWALRPHFNKQSAALKKPDEE